MLCPALLAAEDSTNDLLTRLATALSEGEPRPFLENFDDRMPEYRKLERLVTSLLADSNVGSSITLASEEQHGNGRLLEVGWILEIRSKAETGPSQRRTRRLAIRTELRNKRWIIVALQPVDFFAPVLP